MTAPRTALATDKPAENPSAAVPRAAHAAARAAWIGFQVGGRLPPRRPTAATVPAARAAWEHLAAAGLLDVTARTTLLGLVEGVPDDLRSPAT